MSKEDIDRDDLDEDEEETVHRPQRGWWSQNWPWFLPTLLLAIIVLGGSAIYWALFTRVYNLAACRAAMQVIGADKQVQEALGEPIQTVKWPSKKTLPSARIEEQETDVLWQIEGPKGSAEVHVLARLMTGKWEIVALDVKLADGRKLQPQLAAGGEAEAPVFAPKTEEKKSESKAPPPEINLPVPPANEPGK